VQEGTNPFMAPSLPPAQPTADPNAPPIKFLPLPPRPSAESESTKLFDLNPFGAQAAAANPFELPPAAANPFELGCLAPTNPFDVAKPLAMIGAGAVIEAEPLSRIHSFSEVKGRHFKSIDLSSHAVAAAKQHLCAPSGPFSECCSLPSRPSAHACSYRELHVYTTADAVVLVPSSAPADTLSSCVRIGRDTTPPKIELLSYADALHFATERRCDCALVPSSRAHLGTCRTAPHVQCSGAQWALR
jgi:hypothetical protein